MRVLARAIARGDVSATETVTTWLRRLHEVHTATNCVAAWCDESALAAAADLDRKFVRDGSTGPLHGVPFTVKDWIDAAGVECTGGAVEHRDRIPPRDATAVARLRNAGAIVIAKTAVQVDSALFGPVLNPHDPSRSPGASSSGEAAAVAGGGSPFGLASDSGGSIRVPASWCGATALKPTAGRVPTTGHFPRVGDRSDGRTQIGPIGTSVETLAIVLGIIAGPDDHDPAAAPVALRESADENVAGVRIAFSTDDPTARLTPEVREAVSRTVAALEARGARVVGSLDLHLAEALDITQRYWDRKSGGLNGEETERQLIDWDKYRSRVLRAFASIDAMVTPATASVAPLHRPMTESDYIFTLPASLTGSPSVVLPVGYHDSLPVCVQIVGRSWRDDLVLTVARAVEAARSSW